MRNRLAALTVIALFGPMLVLFQTVTQPAFADMNCDDFPNQAAAQNYFLQHGGPQSDPDDLDADGDGIACESDPCPCSSAQSLPSAQHATPPKKKPKPKPISQAAKIVRVIDPVDVRVKIQGGGTQTVHLIGLLMPLCGKPTATKKLRSFLPRHAKVTLRSDLARPLRQSGKLVRYIERNGQDVGGRLILAGDARVYGGGKPISRKASYQSAQRRARHHHRGSWAHC